MVYLFSRIFKKCELRENMYSMNISTLTVLIVKSSECSQRCTSGFFFFFFFFFLLFMCNLNVSLCAISQLNETLKQ